MIIRVWRFLNKKPKKILISEFWRTYGIHYWIKCQKIPILKIPYFLIIYKTPFQYILDRGVKIKHCAKFEHYKDHMGASRGDTTSKLKWTQNCQIGLQTQTYCTWDHAATWSTHYKQQNIVWGWGGQNCELRFSIHYI